MPHQLRSYFLSQFAKVGCFFAVYKFVSGPCFLCDAVYMTDIDDKASLIVSSSESVPVQSCTWYSLPILVGTLSQCIKMIWNTFSVYQYYLILFLSVSRLFDILSQHLVDQDNLTHFLSGVSRCCSTPMGGFTLPLAKLHIRRLKWAAFLHYIYTIPYHTSPNHTIANQTIPYISSQTSILPSYTATLLLSQIPALAMGQSEWWRYWGRFHSLYLTSTRYPPLTFPQIQTQPLVFTGTTSIQGVTQSNSWSPNSLNIHEYHDSFFAAMNSTHN